MAINPQNNYYGFNPPFIGGPSGVLSRQENDRLIKNDILQLLLTVPGERVMLPRFGTGLRATIFEQLDVATIELLRIDIATALSFYEPRISVQEIILQPDYDRHGLVVRIVYVLLTQPQIIQNLDTFISGGATNG
jgi:phage baseplate assembly protein W